MKNRDMRRKFRILALCSFILAIAIFLFTFQIYHHLTSEMTFAPERLDEPGKPLITFLFGIWGTMFLFCGVISLVIGEIFFGKK